MDAVRPAMATTMNDCRPKWRCPLLSALVAGHGGGKNTTARRLKSAHSSTTDLEPRHGRRCRSRRSSPTPMRSSASTQRRSAAPTCTSSRATSRPSPTGGSSATRQSAPSTSRLGRQERQGRRQGSRVVHHLMRHVPVLPRGPLRSVPRRRRLDPRSQDRRNSGRVRAGAVRRHVDIPGAGRRRRRGPADAGRHPADRLRGRRPQRQVVPATSSRSSAPVRSGWPRSWARGCSARRTSSRSTWPTLGSRPRSSSAPTSSSTTGARTREAIVVS